jgi:hypothetical protein
LDEVISLHTRKSAKIMSFFIAEKTNPLKTEHYGPSWTIRHTDSRNDTDPVVIVPDPGDGSARHLAERILSLLNSSEWGPH